MVNYIWIAFIMVGIIYAMINGTINDVTEAIFSSANEAVTITIGLVSVFVFWLGMMKIAEEVGLLTAIGVIMRPIITRLFPDLPTNHPVIGAIVSNITANLFGLGNAATPFGIKAMQEMKQLTNKNEASRSMITFLALNTSGLTLVPTTMIAIRMQYESVYASEIIITTCIATLASTISAIVFDRIFYKWDKRN